MTYFLGRKVRYLDRFFIQWHITDKCNLNCKHCYRENLKKDLDLKGLSEIFEKIKIFFKEVKPEKKARIQFAGGEPLLSPHIYDFLERAEKEGIVTRILTNGILINNEVAKKIAKTGCKVVQISIEGNEEIHDKIRGKGTFKKSIEAAKALKKHNIEVTFAMTVSKENAEYLDDAIKIALEYADRFAAQRLIPYGSGAQMSDCLLDKWEIKKVFKSMKELKKTAKIDIPYRDPLWGAYNMPLVFYKKENIVTGCSAGYNQFTIESNGDLYPCRRLPIVMGNILEDDLRYIWNCDLMNDLRNRDKLKGNCGKCGIRWYCGGCRAFAYAKDNDYLAEDSQCFRWILI